VGGQPLQRDTRDIAFSKSTDEGKTWSTPIKVNQTPNGATAFTPSVDVSSDGTVAVSYSDWRNNTPAAGLPVDDFIVYSHDGGATWTGSEAKLTPASFDIEQAPVVGSRGYFIGDYQGLANNGSLFDPFFIQVNNRQPSNRTDAFATTVTH
jgi:Neuraminidase (sialidase)